MFRILSKHVLAFGFCSALLLAQTANIVAVRSQAAHRIIALPGEILPYEQVTVNARVNGYVETMLVDRGSAVREGQLLATLSAPELKAQTSELEARLAAAQSAASESEAQLAAAEATYNRLKSASATQGAIAGNELIQAEKHLEAAHAVVESSKSAVKAAAAAVSSGKEMESYLKLTAPFSGVITDRYVHPGALVGPGNGSAGAMLELQQVSRLRVVVPVPESAVAGTRVGAQVEFRVPAYPTRTFAGPVARIGRALDPKTRTMSVELDFRNAHNDLAPGMYPQISWPVSTSAASLVVPATAVVTTTERTFVIRLHAGRAEWVDVRKGAQLGDTVEIFGPLKPGDAVLRRATDEIRNGDSIPGTPQSQAQAARSPR